MEKINYEELEKLGKEHGFSFVCPLDCDTIQLFPEVRQTCKENSCGMYGKSWACPPACGTLEECEKKIRSYKTGILVQTMGELEDSMDWESMMETEALHKKNFFSLEEELRKQYPEMLAVGAGACTRCKVCTYPDQPCRFPEKAFASMEAYGMLVTQVCKANNMKYYHGPCTIAYTSCYLLEKR